MKTILVAVVAAILALSLPEAATAQVRNLRPPAELQDAFQAEFAHRDLAVLQEELALQPDQLIVIETLFGDYGTAFRDGSRAARQRMRELRPADSRGERGVRKSQEAMRRKIEAMRDESRAKAADAPDAESRQRILEEYKAGLETLMRDLEDERSALGFTAQSETHLAEMLEAMADVARDWREEGDRLAAELVANVQAILNEEQLDRWPAVDRRLRREKTIHRGRLAGESLDLYSMIRDLETDEESRVRLAPMLETYSLRIDEALRSRNTLLRETSDALFRAMQLGAYEEATEIATRMIDKHERVRDVNVEYIDVLAGALPDHAAAQLRSNANRRGFPRIYRPTAAARTFKAAVRLRDLDGSQREAVIDLESEYMVLLAARNEALRATTLAHEPTVQRERLTRMSAMTGAGQAQGRVEDPIRAAFDERRVFGDEYVERLRSMLTEEQRQRVPGGPRGAGTREATGSNGPHGR